MQLAVAAIQMESRNGDIRGNLERALPLVEAAAGRGASLICLPEFLPSGYIFDESIWDAAETDNGPTVQWLAEHAKRLNVTLGTSFIEAAGDGFRNVFVLMGPDREYGRVWKQDVALFENSFMEGKAGPHVIQTPFAKIGVGICYENLRSFLSPLLVRQDADLVLQPHSCPGLPDLVPSWGKQIFESVASNTARRYAAGLGIPAVFVNKCGRFDSPTPMFPHFRMRAPFAGYTAIAGSDGRVLEQAGEGSAVLVHTVSLDPGRKTRRPLPSKGKWAIRAPAPALRYMEFVDRRGRTAYAKNRKRIGAARRIAAEEDSISPS